MFPFRFRRLAACLLLAALLPLAACDGTPGRQQQGATAWHRQDLDALLGRWLAVAPTPSGLLAGKFDRQWQQLPAKGGDLTTQARLIYALAIGYESGGDPRYLEQARRGTDFLLERFADPRYGGFFASVAADGKVLNENKNTYGHAFALLALAHMARLTGEARYRRAALAAWADIDRHLGDAEGGFVANAGRDFQPLAGLRTQNPLMHLFEALLALIDATGGDARAVAGARRLGHFVLYRLLVGQPDGGAYIPEWYGAKWRPLASKEQGAYIDVGHQFAWSHLLAGAGRRGLSGLYPAAGERLLQWGIRAGYDEREGGVFNRVYPDGSVDRGKYWWPQAEAMRALLVAAVGSGRSDLWRRYEQTQELVREQFADPAGGWRSGDRRVCERGGCADEQPDPYHMAGLHAAALALAARH